MKSYGYKYRVEIEHMVRSHDGDDWVDSMHWINCNKLDDAIFYAGCPTSTNLIETRIYDMSSFKDMIWRKDWINNTVVDYTTIPDLDYNNREYD